MTTIKKYPDSSELTVQMKDTLKSRLASLRDGVSEHSFANLYLFRKIHNYKISALEGDNLIITGSDLGKKFFMLPFELPDKGTLDKLFEKHLSMKCVSEEKATRLSLLGYAIKEDRDNFDYLYKRDEMASLAGKKYYKKKNRVKKFLSEHSPECLPLTNDRIKDALSVLELWKGEKDTLGDYEAAKEGLLLMEELSLCGAVYYINNKAAAYTLGEELHAGDTFVVHFEKAAHKYTGIFQYVARSFASLLPEKYVYINREQDLGLEGLRQAKESLKPAAFIKKYRVFAK
ncbi:MAG: phosphatidylglycerol lysyltransferase domain-containing protein [Deltaproteobacteria bacterium]|nr:phosphatidylglycerol lysyltransferase domain-containing protein [Deltaproteobacteria bacterium]